MVAQVFLNHRAMHVLPQHQGGILQWTVCEEVQVVEARSPGLGPHEAFTDLSPERPADGLALVSTHAGDIKLASSCSPVSLSL